MRLCKTPAAVTCQIEYHTIFLAAPACPNVHTIALPNAVVQRSSEMLPGGSNTAMLLLLLTSRVPVATATAPEAQRRGGGRWETASDCSLAGD